MGPDKTLLVILMAVGSVAIGTWDLWKGKATDVLRTVILAETALLAGVALEALFPGGLAIGAVLGGVAGTWGTQRIATARAAELKRVLAAAPDVASRLLVLHDRVDAQNLKESGVQKTWRATAVGLLALMGVGLIAMGLTYNVWQALVAGTGLMFLPASQLARTVADTEEQERIQGRITALEQSRDLLVSENSAIDRNRKEC